MMQGNSAGSTGLRGLPSPSRLFFFKSLPPMDVFFFFCGALAEFSPAIVTQRGFAETEESLGPLDTQVSSARCSASNSWSSCSRGPDGPDGL